MGGLPGKSWGWIAGTLALALVVAAVAGWPLLRRAAEAARVMDMIAQAGSLEVTDGIPVNDVTRPVMPQRRVTYMIDGRFHTGDLYLGAAPRASLVLVPGADVLGRDHPQFRAFARALSAAGFAVLVPHMENLRQLKIRTGDVTQIADAVRHMARFSSQGRENSVGLMAVSYGVGPAVLAGLDAKAGPLIGFILGIGGYYDLENVVTFFTTGRFRRGPDENWRQAEPNAHGKWVFLASNAEFLDDPNDRQVLGLIAGRKRRDPVANVDDLAAMLTPEARAVLELATNTDPDRVPDLLRALPAAAREEFGALDLKGADLSRLTARLILVHGRDDRMIPFTESQALAAAAPVADLYVIASMAHVELAPSGLVDAWKLYRVIYSLLALRDTVPPPDFPWSLTEPLDLHPPGNADKDAAASPP